MSRTLAAALTVLVVFAIPSTSHAAMMFAESDGIQLFSVPQPSPGAGYTATMIQARATNPDYSIVTLSNLVIGSGHQVWPNVDVETPRDGSPPTVGPLYASEWLSFDSHLMITPEMVGGNGGAGYAGITEANDGSTTDTLPTKTNIPNTEIGPFGGYGDIRMANPSDGFFLSREHRSNEVDLAYVVTEDGRLADIPVTLTIGLLGSAGSPDAEFFAKFGYDGPINVPMVPEPTAVLPLLLGMLAICLGARR